LRNSRINEPIEITSFLEKYQGVLEEPHIWEIITIYNHINEADRLCGLVDNWEATWKGK
jgi:hypothetical protein